MPFAYYARLTRAQQAIYRRSDAATEIRLPQPAALHPLVGALETALQSENRAATQTATERLIHGLTDALGVPRVRVEVLAARPHRGWGELHGLYTTAPGTAPKIQLWMRTAKQRRVVAFRTYLRTLLHEVGHHIDYTHLRLGDSFHTEGFYKRESSLFNQLVPGAVRNTAAAIRTAAEWRGVPVSERLARLERTPRDLALLLRGHSEPRLSRPPAPGAWSAKEVVCHLRDAEEHLSGWIELVLLVDQARLRITSTADRWASDRQYERHHVGAAWNAFSRRRDDSLALLARLTPGQWQRVGVSDEHGRLTVADLVALMAWHDENHLDQARRAVDGAVHPVGVERPHAPGAPATDRPQGPGREVGSIGARASGSWRPASAERPTLPRPLTATLDQEIRMPTIEAVAEQPIEQRLARMTRTANDLEDAIRGQDDMTLSRRPDPKSWAAKEVLCHLRDTEELFRSRFDLIMAMDEPRLPPLDPGTPDRWADERQYLRNDAGAALAAFRTRRLETLAFLTSLTAEQHTRAAIHPTRGRMTIGDFVTLVAWHDDNHLDQLRRALQGRP